MQDPSPSPRSVTVTSWSPRLRRRPRSSGRNGSGRGRISMRSAPMHPASRKLDPALLNRAAVYVDDLAQASPFRGGERADQPAYLSRLKRSAGRSVRWCWVKKDGPMIGRSRSLTRPGSQSRTWPSPRSRSGRGDGIGQNCRFPSGCSLCPVFLRSSRGAALSTASRSARGRPGLSCRCRMGSSCRPGLHNGYSIAVPGPGHSCSRP